MKLGPVSLNCSNVPNTGVTFPKMVSRLWQHLPRAKSKAKNFRLFVIYHSYLFMCCLADPWPTFGPEVTGSDWVSTTN